MKIWKECKKLRERRFFPENLIKKTKEIIEEVKKEGDKAIKKFTQKFDGIELNSLLLNKNEIEKSEKYLKEREKWAIESLKKRIENFSIKEKEKLNSWMSGKDIRLGKTFVPLERVGVYVPGGKFPLPSSLLMSCIPAKTAGVKEIAIATPPDKKGNVNPAILYAAKISGIKEIYRMGGAQAIASFAFGTESINRVEKIVGPGNIYVTIAKKLLFGEVGIDMLAGPSEVLVIADEKMPEKWVKWDILSQLEHGIDSIGILITTSSSLSSWIYKEMKNLKGDIKKAWERGGGIYEVESIEEAIDVANKISPEHLILGIKNAKKWVKKVKNAGTIFLGYLSPVSAGDFGVGINHILPTGGNASFSSSLGVRDFMKEINMVELNRKGIEKISPIVKTFSKIERLPIHGEEISCREEKMKP